jgi:anti-anti-sigma factor
LPCTRTQGNPAVQKRGFSLSSAELDNLLFMGHIARTSISQAILSGVTDDQERGLALSIRCIGDIAVLAVRGELDAVTAPQLEEAIRTQFKEESTALVVDLMDLDFFASAGMTVLLDGQETATQLRKRFGVVADGPRTSRPMKLMGLDQVLALYPSLESALSAV